MKNQMKKSVLTLGTVASVVAPVAAVVACGDKEDNGVIKFDTIKARAAVTPATYQQNQARKVLVVVDGKDHSISDNSFNQQGEEAATAIASAHTTGPITKADAKNPANDNTAGFTGMYETVDAGSIILAPGFAHIGPIMESKAALAGKYVVLVDGDVSHYKDGTDAGNVASIEFKTEQAAFIAGVMSGHYLNAHKDEFGEELKVGAFGGLNFPTVTCFMAGYQQGIEYFNAHKTANQTAVSFIDLGGKADYYSGGFAPGGGTAIAQKLLNKGADLILPVAGPQTADVIAEIKKNAGSHTRIIGVDTKQEEMYAKDKHNGKTVVAFSILKQIKKAFTDVVAKMEGGNPSATIKGLGELTIGDLTNGLVGVSQTGTTTGNVAEAFKSIYDTAATPAALTAAKAATITFKY